METIKITINCDEFIIPVNELNTNSMTWYMAFGYILSKNNVDAKLQLSVNGKNYKPERVLDETVEYWYNSIYDDTYELPGTSRKRELAQEDYELYLSKMTKAGIHLS